MNIIRFLLSKKEIEREIENLDRDLFLEKAKNNKLKKQIQSLEEIEERNLMYFTELKSLKKELKKIKKENNFLIERENKLQKIEQILIKKGINIEELDNIKNKKGK